MMFIVIFLYISNSVISAKTLGSDDVMSRILFGSPAPIEQYPFFARITREGQHWCGAAIISDRWLLTAAHCIYRDNVYIVGGDEKDSYKVAADIVVRHQNYVDNGYILDNDIALVRLASRLQFSNKVQPIKLGTNNQVKGPLHSIGRGLNEYGSVPSRLMKVNLTEVDIRHCGVYPVVGNNFICATRSPPFANVCQGDSGSPLVSYGESNVTLIGITSYITDPNCLRNKYSAFVRVSTYIPWIQSIMMFYGMFGM